MCVPCAHVGGGCACVPCVCTGVFIFSLSSEMVTKFSAVCIMLRKIKEVHEPQPQSKTHTHERWNRQYEVYELSGNDR